MTHASLIQDLFDVFLRHAHRWIRHHHHARHRPVNPRPLAFRINPVQDTRTMATVYQITAIIPHVDTTDASHASVASKTIAFSINGAAQTPVSVPLDATSVVLTTVPDLNTTIAWTYVYASAGGIASANPATGSFVVSQDVLPPVDPAALSFTVQVITTP